MALTPQTCREIMPLINTIPPIQLRIPVGEASYRIQRRIFNLPIINMFCCGSLSYYSAGLTNQFKPLSVAGVMPALKMKMCIW